MSGKPVPDEQFTVLHRHWIWANLMRTHFDVELKKKATGDAPEKTLAGHYGTYMCLWYSLLYSVLEVIRDKGYAVPGIEEANDIMDPLRKFRNAVFHPQAEYWSKKFLGIWGDHDSVSKIRTVHSALGKFFLEEARKRNRTTNEK